MPGNQFRAHWKSFFCRWRRRCLMCVCFALLRSVLRSGLFCLAPPCLCSLALSPCFTRIILHAQHVCYLLCSWLFPFCVISCFRFSFSYSLSLSLSVVYLFSICLCAYFLQFFAGCFSFFWLSFSFALITNLNANLGPQFRDEDECAACGDKRQVLLSCHLTTLLSPLNGLKMLLMCLRLCACLRVSSIWIGLTHSPRCLKSHWWQILKFFSNIL